MTVKVVDLSHCYWFPAATIVTTLIHLKNLEELYVKDTKLSLAGIALIFQECFFLKKLSIDVKERSWKEYSDTPEWKLFSLRNGIERLSSIHFCFEGNSYEVWHLIFRVLGYQIFPIQLSPMIN